MITELNSDQTLVSHENLVNPVYSSSTLFPEEPKISIFNDLCLSVYLGIRKTASEKSRNPDSEPGSNGVVLVPDFHRLAAQVGDPALWGHEALLARAAALPGVGAGRVHHRRAVDGVRHGDQVTSLSDHALAVVRPEGGIR